LIRSKKSEWVHPEPFDVILNVAKRSEIFAQGRLSEESFNWMQKQDFSLGSK